VYIDAFQLRMTVQHGGEMLIFSESVLMRRSEYVKSCPVHDFDMFNWAR
jgi:hypothetical protein